MHGHHHVHGHDHGHGHGHDHHHGHGHVHDLCAPPREVVVITQQVPVATTPPVNYPLGTQPPPSTGYSKYNYCCTS